MHQKHPLLKCCGLYGLGLLLFLSAQSSTVSGSPLHLSYPVRVVLCILAICTTAAGAVVWNPKRRPCAAFKFLLAAAIIGLIITLGFTKNWSA